MGNLAFVGSHSINGVSALHTDLMKQSVFRELNELFPGRINNKTNGVTPRRWLKGVNGELAHLYQDAIGGDIFANTDRLKEALPLGTGCQFHGRFQAHQAQQPRRTVQSGHGAHGPEAGS